MDQTQDSSGNVAIVALIIVGVLIAGAIALYFNGNFDSKPANTNNTTTIIEKIVPAPAEPKAKESDFSLKFEDNDGNKTEIEGK